MTSKFSLENICPEVFPATGAELCELRREDFADLSGSVKSAGILATHLAHLRGLDPREVDLTFEPVEWPPSTSSSQASSKPSTYLSLDQGKQRLDSI